MLRAEHVEFEASRRGPNLTEESKNVQGRFKRMEPGLETFRAPSSTVGLITAAADSMRTVYSLSADVDKQVQGPTAASPCSCGCCSSAVLAIAVLLGRNVDHTELTAACNVSGCLDSSATVPHLLAGWTAIKAMAYTRALTSSLCF